MKVIGAIAQWSVLGLIRGSEKILFENIKYFYLLTEKKFKSSDSSLGCRVGLMSFWTPQCLTVQCRNSQINERQYFVLYSRPPARPANLLKV